MGGSLAAACRRKFPRARIIGVTRSRHALRTALKRRWIHQGFRDLSRGVQNADLVVLCTPVDTFPKLLKAVDRAGKKGVLVTDVGSVKGSVERWIGKRSWSHLRFVGAHPMVGSHQRGIEVANKVLYDHGFTFLVRSRRTDQKSYGAVKAFWRKISSRLIETDAETHDKIVAEISHLPHAIAACLLLAVSKKSLGFAASGFRDTTRIAEGHPSIWLPILHGNACALLNALDDFEKQLKNLRRALQSKNARILKKILDFSSQKRSQI